MYPLHRDRGRGLRGGKPWEANTLLQHGDGRVCPKCVYCNVTVTAPCHHTASASRSFHCVHTLPLLIYWQWEKISTWVFPYLIWGTDRGWCIGFVAPVVMKVHSAHRSFLSLGKSKIVQRRLVASLRVLLRLRRELHFHLQIHILHSLWSNEWSQWLLYIIYRLRLEVHFTAGILIVLEFVAPHGVSTRGH